MTLNAAVVEAASPKGGSRNGDGVWRAGRRESTKAVDSSLGKAIEAAPLGRKGEVALAMEAPDEKK